MEKTFEREEALKQKLKSLSIEELKALTRALPAIARRAQLKLIPGGRQDPKPDTLKGEFPL